jgi:hypothetical protein
MIKLKLKRDDARLLETAFLPYMVMLAQSRLRSAEHFTLDYFNSKIVLSLISEVQLSFKRKLLGKAKKMLFNFNDAHAIAFYMMLMKQPVDEKHVYALNLRHQICDALHKQLYQPEVKEPEETEFVTH